MKTCTKHWEELKQAIRDRGLEHLVSKNGAECAERFRKMHGGDTDPKLYDPLFDSHMMIMANAASAAPYLLEKENAELCCLCELDAHKAEMGEGASDWIRNSTDGALGHCRANGLTHVQ